MATGKFSLQWVNDFNYKRPMNTARFNLRDALSAQGEAGLTCRQLFLDQVHIQFRPTPDIKATEYRVGDSDTLDWINESLQLYVRLTPGVRHTLYTSGVPHNEAEGSSTSNPQRSLVYSAALCSAWATSGDGDDTFCKSYRPVRDLPVLVNGNQVSELQVDLLWPLMQGDPTRMAWWSMPDYRMIRIICEFSFVS